MLNLSVVLSDSAHQYPNKEAIVFGPVRLTYTEVEAASNQVANGLRANGIARGDKVALCCPNLPYFPIAYYGILKAGATVVPLNVLLKKREFAYHLQDADCAGFLCFEGTPDLPIAKEAWEAFQGVDSCRHLWFLPATPGGPAPIEGGKTFADLVAGQPPVFDMEQMHAEDTAVILYTSGTTGKPKGAELTHVNMLMNAVVGGKVSDVAPEDISLVTLPLFHSFGQSVQMNAGIMAGVTLVLVPRFDAGTVLQLFQDENVTLFAGVPTMYWDILNYPDAEKFDLKKIAGTLRACASGGAAMPVEVMKQFERKFCVKILEGYGLSETSPLACSHTLKIPRKPGSIGPPVWGVEMRVVDEHLMDVAAGEPGEIIIRGHNVMKGYYKMPEATGEAFRGGWFHTGDMGKMDEDGYFYIVDRTKDMIIRGGFNVYPREIEEVLVTHPDISLAAVVGVPHEEYGEEVMAFVVPKAGKTVEPTQVVRWAKEQMAAYKYPRMVKPVDELPLGPTGKILKTELRGLAEQAAAEHAKG